MKILVPYIASMVGFTAAMSLHAAGEIDPRIRRGKARAVLTAPLWPLYIGVAYVALARGSQCKVTLPKN